MKTSCYIDVTIVNHWLVSCDHAGVLPSKGKCYDCGIVTINSFLPRLGTFTTTIIVSTNSQKTSNNATVSVPVSPTLIMNTAVKRNSKNSWLPRDWWRAATWLVESCHVIGGELSRDHDAHFWLEGRSLLSRVTLAWSWQCQHIYHIILYLYKRIILQWFHRRSHTTQYNLIMHFQPR